MIAIILSLITMSSTIVKDLYLDVHSLSVEQGIEYQKIRLSCCELTDEIGAPELPVKTMKFALPFGARITDIMVLRHEVEELPGRYMPSCVQPPVILSQKQAPESVEPRPDIYSSPKPYPPKLIELKGVYRYNNYSICELLFYPVQYIPAERRLRFYYSVTLQVSYEGGVQSTTSSELLRMMVSNPEDVKVSDKRSRAYFEYLIITEPPMDTVFERLADWKTKKGIKAELRTVDWIISHYSGEDDAAKIRNYIKTLPDSSVRFVLLAGDTDVIPCRLAYAMTCEYGGDPREDSLPCDLYYADLEGDWDFNDNGVYGEVADSINLYPDIFVGRAPVNTIAEAQKFVEKVLIYEKNPDLGYCDNALFTADILWWNPYTDQAIHKNMIEDESFSPNFEITKLYYSQGNLSPSEVLAALEDGQGLINHDGHGWIQVMSAGTGYLHSTDFDIMTNAPKYGIWISCGCWTTAFDYDAIGEHFVNSPNGGGVAFIGNSSYGWGSPGNPGFGYSDRFDSRFFYSLLQEQHFNLGAALALAKAHFIPYSREENVYRWHQYQLNLLGDPEMLVWSDVPETLDITYPQSIPQGNSRIFITVTDKHTGTAVQGALVCLMKGDESYASGYTDVSGSVFLDASPSTLGDCDLTVTAHDYLPVEITVPVVSGPYVNYLGWEVNDSLGNDDGIANPNEDIFLNLMVRNSGNATAHNIELILRSQDPYVTILDSSASLTSLDVDDSLLINNAFRIMVGGASNGHGISFELEITDVSRTLVYNPILIAGTPLLSVADVVIVQPPTMPSEIESLQVNLENAGFGFGHETYARLSSNDMYISVVVDSVWYGEIDPESVKVGVQPFVVSVDPSCPTSYLAPLPLNLHTADYSFTDTIHVLIGETGFWDDMESGTGLWTTGGSDNLWHMSQDRSFSPTHAWYCGDTTTGYYHNNMNCYIQTIPFMIQANSVLSFCRWFDVPIYGTDGIYVIIMGNGYADTLDFIGTGGALNGRGILSDWFEEVYSLSHYPAGETIQVRIAFISDYDGDVGEGFYIDDVHIDRATMIEEFREPGTSQLIFELFPNPFFNRVDIRLQMLDMTKKTTLRIFDVTGRLVKDLSPLLSDMSHHLSVISWSGIDELSRKVPAGVYLVQLEGQEVKLTRKVILLR